MPNLNLIKHSFAGGEIAPSLYSRTDLALYGKAAKLLKNWIVHPHGGASNRPGTLYQATAKFDNKKVRLIPFKYSTLQNYIVEFGDYYARFYTNLGAGGQILSGQYSVDSYTKALLQMDGVNGSLVFTDDTGKTVVNSQVELDYMEYASNALAQAAYVTNDTAETIDQSFTGATGHRALGDLGGYEYRQAQSFQLSGALTVTAIELRNGVTGGSPSGNWTIRIETDNAGAPSGTLANVNASVSVTPPAADANVKGSFATPFTLSGSTLYWIVVRCNDQSNDNFWGLEGDEAGGYSSGSSKTSSDGGSSWGADNGDTYFKLYTSSPSLQSYSESSIKTQGTYSLKFVGLITSSLNKTLTRTISVPIDLSGLQSIDFDVRASRTGSNFKIGFHDAGGTTTEHTPDILVADTFQSETVDLSTVADADKNAIDSIIITITDADAENTGYIDNIIAGGVRVDTSVKEIGTASGYFDGASKLTLAQSVDFNLETADFTLEGFINIHTLGDMYFCGNGAETSGGCGIFYDNTAHTLAFWANNGSRASVAFTPLVDTFYHFAAVRTSGTIKLAIGGVFGSGSTYATAINSIYDLAIGCDSQVVGKKVIGRIDAFRFSKGVARWTTDFTPPASTNLAYEIETPYAEADLPLLNYTQSADVLYIAHPTIKPKELIRYSNTNWTLTDYDFLGGPFMLPNTTITKTLASSATAKGDSTTLTAVGFTFQSTHVGSLWQLEHYIEGQAVSQAFGSVTTSTAIKCAGTWRIITHGTWTGKLRIERSADGSTGWTNLREFSSANDYNPNTYGTEDMSNNAEPFFVRMNMTAYTSGTCNADLSTDAFYQKGIAQIDTVAVGGATATATITRAIGLTTATIDWTEGAWSDYRGWPSVVEFSPQDRLMWANNTTNPQTHWDTQIGNYYDFSRSDPLVDSDGITKNLPAREVNGITSIVPLSTIIALTSSSEWGILSSSGASISPTSILHKIYGYEGSSGVRPVVIGNRAIYVQVLSSIVRDLGYELYSDSFTGADISILSNHLLSGHTITDMAYQQNPDRLVWCIRDDGKLLTLTYMREQEVIAWTWQDTNEGTDLFESLASIPNSVANYNEVWFSVKRGTKRYIERLSQRLPTLDAEDQVIMDSAVTYDGSPATVISNLTHLNGYTVSILADGNVLPQQTVSGGTITLPAAYSKVHIGIPYNSDLETLNVEVNMPDGTLQGRRVKISEVSIRVTNSRGGYIGPDLNTLHSISGSPMSGSTVLTYDAPGVLTLCSGEIKENLGAGYEDGGRMFFRQSDPLPVTLVALLPIVQPAERTGL